jgi:peptidoglycan/xylan/chitin deacetylase (PgdA/CDA1 family)
LPVRTLVKSLGERVIATSGITAVSRARRAGRTLVLAYHNIVPDDHPVVGDRSLHLPLAKFRAQLVALRATHEVVSLESVAATNPGGRPRAVITFDDAYRGAILLGLPELARLGLPATVFVAPGLLDVAGFWWDRFAPSGRDWDGAIRNWLLTEGRGREAAAAAWAEANRIAPSDHGPWLRGASELELTAAAALPGITIGAHSWSHPNLASLTGDELHAEVSRPLIWLRGRFPKTVPWLAYPYGLASTTAAEAARLAGFSGAFLVQGGWLAARGLDPFWLARWNVPSGLSLAGFQLRTAGLFCR